VGGSWGSTIRNVSGLAASLWLELATEQPVTRAGTVSAAVATTTAR
jgi:hypothetical protein